MSILGHGHEAPGCQSSSPWMNESAPHTTLTSSIAGCSPTAAWLYPHREHDKHNTLNQCLLNVGPPSHEGGPTLNHHWLNVLCLPGTLCAPGAKKTKLIYNPYRPTRVLLCSFSVTLGPIRCVISYAKDANPNSLSDRTNFFIFTSPESLTRVANELNRLICLWNKWYFVHFLLIQKALCISVFNNSPTLITYGRKFSQYSSSAGQQVKPARFGLDEKRRPRGEKVFLGGCFVRAVSLRLPVHIWPGIRPNVMTVPVTSSHHFTSPTHAATLP